ncbi:MAG: dipeptide epimerase [Myxococcales bacterium]|nr:dipeptide epimerase [Myxococcales bacterium]
MLAIRHLRAEAFDVALTTPFGIAGGKQEVANNVLVTLELEDGTLGLGEAAPFPVVSGETRDQTLASLESMRSVVTGQDARRWRRIAAQLAELAPGAPAARCAVETALLDALCRHAGMPLWEFFGGAELSLHTDITLVTGTVADTRAAAERAAQGGFELLKVKIGGTQLDTDLARLVAVLEAAPRARLILDANAAFSSDEALAVLSELGPFRSRIVLFEQPTPAGDIEGLRRVRENGRIAVAADESAKNARAVTVLARERAADVINLKLMKSGVAEALDMALTARALGLRLMIGGMVETELAMTTGACFAAGLGGFSFVDLDTPLFMAKRPLAGGFEQRGPELSLAEIKAGHGVERVRDTT